MKFSKLTILEHCQQRMPKASLIEHIERATNIVKVQIEQDYLCNVRGLNHESTRLRYPIL